MTSAFETYENTAITEKQTPGVTQAVGDIYSPANSQNYLSALAAPSETSGYQLPEFSILQPPATTTATDSTATPATVAPTDTTASTTPPEAGSIISVPPGSEPPLPGEPLSDYPTINPSNPRVPMPRGPEPIGDGPIPPPLPPQDRNLVFIP